LAWLTRNLDACGIIVAGTEEAPEPAKRGRGQGRRRRGPLRGKWERVYGEDLGRDRGEGEILGTGQACKEVSRDNNTQERMINAPPAKGIKSLLKYFWRPFSGDRPYLRARSERW
jgi:hypothetical protein